MTSDRRRRHPSNEGRGYIARRKKKKNKKKSIRRAVQ